MHKLGPGLTEDQEVAAQRYRKLAEQGPASAQTNLGAMHAFGTGVSKDYAYAYMWGGLGASNGSVNGAKLRDDFGQKRSSSPISEAKRLAINCKKNNYKGCWRS